MKTALLYFQGLLKNERAELGIRCNLTERDSKEPLVERANRHQVTNRLTAYKPCKHG